MATKPSVGGDVNLGSGDPNDTAISNGDEVSGRADLPQQAGTIGGQPVFTPPDLPDPLIAQDGPPPIDPDGGSATTATAFGAGAKGAGSAAEAGDPVVTSNIAGLPTQVGTPDEPVEIVDDGEGKPGEEGSAVEGARAGLADVVPDGFGSIGLDDLASGEEGTEDDLDSLYGLDRASEQELAARLPGGGKESGSSSETSFSGGGGGGKGGSETSFSGGGGQQGQLRDEFAGRGEPPQDYAPGDFGADPDQPPSGGNPSAEQGAGDGAVTVGDHLGDIPLLGDPLKFAKDNSAEPGTTGSVRDSVMREALDEQDRVAGSEANPPNPGPDDVVSDVTSKDGSVHVVKFGDGTTVVDDGNNHTTTTLYPDGSTTTVDRTTGERTTTDPLGQPAGDTEVVLTPAEQQELRDSIDALGQHRGDQGRETQPTEGDDGAFGAGAPKSEISILDTRDRAIDMLGQPGSSDLDFGGGGGGGGGRLPDDGAIDPGRDADAPRQTDGAEQDPFDRQQGTLEPTAESDDDGSDDGASLLQPGDLRPVDETEHLREVTLDIG